MGQLCSKFLKMENFGKIYFGVFFRKGEWMDGENTVGDDDVIDLVMPKLVPNLATTKYGRLGKKLVSSGCQTLAMPKLSHHLSQLYSRHPFTFFDKTPQTESSLFLGNLRKFQAFFEKKKKKINKTTFNNKSINQYLEKMRSLDLTRP